MHAKAPTLLTKRNPRSFSISLITKMWERPTSVQRLFMELWQQLVSFYSSLDKPQDADPLTN